MSFLNIPRGAPRGELRTVGPPPQVPFWVRSRRALTYSVLAGFMTGFIACPLRYVVLRTWITPPSLQQLRWLPPIIVAIEYVGIVLVAAFSGAIAGYGPGVRLGDSRTRRNLVLFTIVAVWTAPLIILLLERSAWAGLIAAAMVIAGFSVLRRVTDEEVYPSPAAIQSQQGFGNFSQLEDLSRLSKSLALVILATAALEAAGLANWIAEREIAFVLFVVGAAVLATQLPRGSTPNISPRLLSRDGTRLALSAGCATAMVLVGLLPFIASSNGDASLAALLRSLFVRKAGGAVVRNHAVRLQETPIRSDGYIGVILTPKRMPQVSSRQIPQLVFNRKAMGLKNPLHIPFTGSYWFFQDPFVRPPFDSVRAEGDPANVGVRSSNRKPLQMEAVQTLDEPIETRDIDKIKLAMLDADQNPQTISVELVLADTRTWGIPMLSLGVERLEQSSDLMNVMTSHSETEGFKVPLHCDLVRFNQIRLIFRLDPSRDRRAAAIAIDSFVLVPRGL
ncbi:MAG TPA: hypothetical protein VFU50_04600 [Terriglobales bacterium]|nr:hypothetical protein [Terriglobales bacterium]